MWRTKEGTLNNAESLNSVSALLLEIWHNLQNLLNDPGIEGCGVFSGVIHDHSCSPCKEVRFMKTKSPLN